jgi:hypothetical protein
MVDAAPSELAQCLVVPEACARDAAAGEIRPAPGAAEMNVRILEPARSSSQSLNDNRSKLGHPNPPTDIIMLALWSSTGLVISVPFVPLLTDIIVDDAFSVLLGTLG